MAERVGSFVFKDEFCFNSAGDLVNGATLVPCKHGSQLFIFVCKCFFNCYYYCYLISTILQKYI